MDLADNIGLSRMDIFVLAKGNLNENVTVIYEEIEKNVSGQLGHPFTLPESVKPVIRKLMTSLRTIVSC